MHSFCHLCLANWYKRSTNCPICRSESYLIVKNPLIDQFIDLLVEFTFTEEEKTERRNLIQQRSLPSSGATEEAATLLRDIEQVAYLDPSLDVNLFSRTVCVTKAHSLLYKIFSSDQFNQLKDDADCTTDMLLAICELLDSFADNVHSLEYFDVSPFPDVTCYLYFPSHLDVLMNAFSK